MTGPFKDALLALAADILRSGGYAIEPFEVDFQTKGLRAENLLFVVNVVSAPTMTDLVRMNGAVSGKLAREFSEGMGPKRWDGYLVLLTQESVLDIGEATVQLYNLSYDTSVVRRIARAGVEASLSAIREILRPFLPLEPHGLDSFGDPLELLRAELVLQGIPDAVALRTVSAFREDKSLRNV